MKLRILRNTRTASGVFRPGVVVVIPNPEAESLIKSEAARVEDGTPWVPGAEPQLEPKEHKHYYRKNGVCACGAVKKVKGSKAGPTARQIRETAAAEADKKAKAKKPKTKIEPDPV